MRIGIDARFYFESGVGRYLRNLIFNLQKIDKKNEYIIFVPTKKSSEINLAANFHKIETDIPWYGIAEQIKFPVLLSKHKLDLVHFPHFNVPILYRGKFVVTIHDLIHQHFSMQRATTKNIITYKLKTFGYKKVFSNALKKSLKIITVSNSVKEQLIEEWDANQKKIVVTKEGVDEKLLAIAKKLTQAKTDSVLDKFNIEKPFIFYVGNAHPHKNIEGLIESFKIVRQNYQYMKLVLAGPDHFFWQRIKREFKHKDIVFTGELSDMELGALYKSANCFVMPSFEEGFGIPVLEAFAFNCPVVASNIKAIKEIGGNGVSYFNPKNPTDMAEKIMTVLNSKQFSHELVKNGAERLKNFSWKKMAKETLTIFKDSL